ncbi:outer membrane protein assembly factor BamB [Sessilibacter corallicola]|uniref:Outer membrane protein assembly factor BamB n=1 Tax=Sessilibacter corallicola TaxID=2904075 RepID=A0ABQ0A9S8_9GAMM|nr:outer membrane protein assembly factor BamB [Sessilibacter corallicola]MCE2029358.1 outer membrane protein assembly factor BamB [Sessilibacter corallicola]
MRLVIVALAIFALAACSSTPKEVQPSPLVKVSKQIKVNQLWSKSGGKIDDKKAAKIVPALANGRAYTADIKGRVYAFDSSTGKKLWQEKVGKNISGGVGANTTTVAVGTYDGEVIALNADDGSELWRVTVSTEVLSAPQLNSKLVVVHTIDGRLHGLDVTTGEQVWLYDNTAPLLTFRGTSSPLVTDTIVAAGFDNGKVIGLNPRNGIAQWDVRVAIPKGRTDLERVVDIDGSPVMLGDLLFAASYQGRMVAVSRSSGRGLWAVDTSTYRGLSTNGYSVFVTADNDEVKAHNVANGEPVWTNDQMLRRKLTGPAVLGDYVLIADSEGYLHVLSAESGDYLGRRKVSGSGVNAPIVVFADTAYVLDNRGTLHAYQVEAIAQ